MIFRSWSANGQFHAYMHFCEQIVSRGIVGSRESCCKNLTPGSPCEGMTRVDPRMGFLFCFVGNKHTKGESSREEGSSPNGIFSFGCCPYLSYFIQIFFRRGRRVLRRFRRPEAGMSKASGRCAVHSGFQILPQSLLHTIRGCPQ